MQERSPVSPAAFSLQLAVSARPPVTRSPGPCVRYVLWSCEFPLVEALPFRQLRRSFRSLVRRFHRCRVGGGAPRGRWPPSAAQTVRAVFPHTAFTKTSSRDEDRWRNQRVEPSSGPSGSASRQVSSVADVGVFHSWNCPPQRPCSSHRPVWSRPSSPAAFPNPLGCRPLTVTRLSPRFRYYSAVRLLDEHPFPLRSRL